MKYAIMKEIGIDAAHRVPDHASKCRNLHGHRYKIEVYVEGEELQGSGAESGMLMDFSFLKQLMEEFIDANCDHGLIVYSQDYPLLQAINPHGNSEGCFDMWSDDWYANLEKFGAARVTSSLGKTYVVPFIPTAENLARHWYELLQERVKIRSKGHATIQRVRVYETPTSVCDYPSK